MTETTIAYEGDQTSMRCNAMVCLHGHTLHSHETLVFIKRFAANFAPLGAALAHAGARYRSVHGTDLNLNRAWWTPPMAPHDAWLLESSNIERKYEVKPLVSLTDHDDIEAPVTLRILSECSHLPISVEWTVPIEDTFFHLGVHNLPPASARQIMLELSEYTANPDESRLGGLLESVATLPGVLVVFNYPCWDEQGIGQKCHMDRALRFAASYARWLQAFELNGAGSVAGSRQSYFSPAAGRSALHGGERCRL